MDQFDEIDNAMTCAVCEAMCPEAVDGTLTAAEQKAFDKHVAGCVTCSEELAEAHRGAAWMGMLKGFTPEPPAALLQRILAETTGAAVPSYEAAPAFVPAAIPYPAAAGPSRAAAQWASLRESLSGIFSLDSARLTFQPRFAMTAAMAFFSIALTLNMTGVRLQDVRAGLLRPSSLRRSVADASASATRSFQNLRVVYEFESRVSDMRNNGGLGSRFSDDNKEPASPFVGTQQKEAPATGAPEPQNAPEKKPEQTIPRGRSELIYPLKPTSSVEKGA